VGVKNGAYGIERAAKNPVVISLVYATITHATKDLPMKNSVHTATQLKKSSKTQQKKSTVFVNPLKKP